MNIRLVIALAFIMPLGVRAAAFSKGDTVRLTRDLPLLFNDTVYREGREGEKFTVYTYNPVKGKVYILTQTAQGQTIALNIRDDALELDQPTTAGNTSPTSAETPAPSHRPGESAEDSNNPYSVLFGIGSVALIIVAISRTGRWAKMREAKKYLNRAEKAGCLPTVQTRLMLKKGEAAVYNAPAKLYETRTVRDYKSGHVGFRVAKGVWVGGSRGRSISSQHWQEIDNGTLIVTNQRFVFEGRQESRNADLSKILSTTFSSKAIEVNVANRQKALAFTARNPALLVAIIRAANALNDAKG